MNLIVTGDEANQARGRLLCNDDAFACALGRSGITTDKSEGDGKTPAGLFALRQVLYRPDRLNPPQTKLPVASIKESDGWCNAPDDPNYNRLVSHPYQRSAERLWRDDDLYNVILVIGHNDQPVVPGAGSAIFVHVATDDYAPTEGCVALHQAHLLELLVKCEKRSWIKVTPHEF